MRDADDVAAVLNVDPRRGLDAGRVVELRSRVGSNRLREAEREPAWWFLRPFQDLLVVVLLIAAAVSAEVELRALAAYDTAFGLDTGPGTGWGTGWDGQAAS